MPAGSDAPAHAGSRVCRGDGRGVALRPVRRDLQLQHIFSHGSAAI